MIFNLKQTIRNFKNRDELFLTFDDGPAEGTLKVLATLDKHGVKATFFVVASHAVTNKKTVHEIINQGHSIGNHSLDHGYSNFFKGKKALKNWIIKSEDLLQNIIGHPTVGFRPPAGVVTPELGHALTELNMPLILWKTRFFDTRFLWTEQKAINSIGKSQPGDIVLLHDRQSSKNLADFIKTLDSYLIAAREKGFEFSKI